MIYTCTDGFGKKIDIELARVVSIDEVSTDYTFFAFKARYQEGTKAIEVGAFKNRNDAQRERDALDKAKADEVNSI